MARHNTAAHTPLRTAPTTGAKTPDTRNAAGAPAHSRDPLTELYLLAVAYMGTGGFYETELGRAERFRTLVAQAATTDPDWMGRFLPWLRGTAGMRAASVEAGVEAAYAMTRAGIPGGRGVLASALQRADEPAEALAYARARYGRTLPRAVANGLADACTRLYNEFSAGKWDSAEGHYRFGDLIRTLHPRPKDEVQAALFRYLSRTRTDAGMAIPYELGMVRAARAARKELLGRGKAALDGYEPEQLRRHLKGAGLTWEDLLTIAGETDIEARFMWELCLPYVGYQALVKNLRTLDHLGVSDELAAQAAARIADPDQAMYGRMLPLAFWKAHKAVGTLRWGHALEQGLNHTLAHITALGGRTLVLADRSGSMFWDSLEELRKRLRQPGRAMLRTPPPGHQTTLADAAALFASAVAKRAQAADLWWFDHEAHRVAFHRTDSVLTMMGRFGGERGGTDIAGALAQAYAGHDRVVIVTDEQDQHGHRQVRSADWAHQLTQGQARYDVLGRVVHEPVVPERVPVYVWNLGGYPAGYLPHNGNRFVFGGLSDASFGMVSQLEHSGKAAWPF